MSKHTPGPWRVEAKQIRAGSYVILADLHTWDNDTLNVRAEASANARLIAAAPELLDALRAVLRWMPVYPASADGIVGGRESHAAALASARAAIAKATGETA